MKDARSPLRAPLGWSLAWTALGPVRHHVLALVGDIAAHRGHPVLSDERLLAIEGIVSGSTPGPPEVLVVEDPDGRCGFALVSTAVRTETGPVATVELLVPAGHGPTINQPVATAEPGAEQNLDDLNGADGMEGVLLSACVERFQKTHHLQWWVYGADDVSDRVAQRLGFRLERELLQLRCPLPRPMAGPGSLPWRSFVVNQDEPAWLVANNRAFAGHPDQGSWTRADLLARQGLEWFSPEGFLILEEEGRIIGSCWTKLHEGVNGTLGEIYVISVDPDAQGRGLGKALTEAGLDHLTEAGATEGMLYVDATNMAALATYRSIGFTTHHVDRMYASPPPRST